MGDWFLGEGRAIRTVGAIASTSSGRAMANSGVANTKGAWLDIVGGGTGIPVDAQGFLVCLAPSNSTNYLVDIAIGPGGSEKVIVADLYCSLRSNQGAWYYFPIAIPAGTIIWARFQSTHVSVVVSLSMLLFGGSPATPMRLARCVSYGATSSGDSKGTDIDPGTTADAKGAYVQLTASLGFDTKALLLAIGNAGDTTKAADQTWRVDLAIGAGGSETVIVPDILLGWTFTTASNLEPKSAGPFPCHIPAGTRLAARAQCSVNTATDRLIDVVAYAMG